MKKLRYLLLKSHAKLNASELDQLNAFFLLAPDLKKAYIVKETFQKWLMESDKNNVKKNLEHLYDVIENSGLEEYQSMKITFKNWEKGDPKPLLVFLNKWVYRGSKLQD